MSILPKGQSGGDQQQRNVGLTISILTAPGSLCPKRHIEDQQRRSVDLPISVLTTPGSLCPKRRIEDQQQQSVDLPISVLTGTTPGSLCPKWRVKVPRRVSIRLRPEVPLKLPRNEPPNPCKQPSAQLHLTRERGGGARLLNHHPLQGHSRLLATYGGPLSNRYSSRRPRGAKPVPTS